MACIFFLSGRQLTFFLTSNLFLFRYLLPADSEQQQPKRQLSLLCWADVIPQQPEGGAFAQREAAGDRQGTVVLVDLKTLSAAPLLGAKPAPLLLLLPPFLGRCGASPPPLLRVVDVRPLGKAGRVASATRVVVRQERLKGGERDGGSGSSSGIGSGSARAPSVSGEALSAVLANALVEVGAAVLPAGAASSLLFFSGGEEGIGSSPPLSPLCLLRVVAAEPEGSGAPRREVDEGRASLEKPRGFFFLSLSFPFLFPPPLSLSFHPLQKGNKDDKETGHG